MGCFEHVGARSTDVTSTTLYATEQAPELLRSLTRKRYTHKDLTFANTSRQDHETSFPIDQFDIGPPCRGDRLVPPPYPLGISGSWTLGSDRLI